ncbi:hypothetical protein [Hymenobacter chitinivorans]|uniref:DUF4919 domain-containing protein n=1 Tax=Hymenobacter chitinivorans DSM 11115 TaxID=1121954 RepID=A0A2M9BRI7_9BACT|nr:hypothetical protein [Hymenobacter chitinivorans]PJJ60564.1 hypothetical protein CLV45_1993 [Hymenobacter chitinivorans DSM 11115]
MNIFAWILGASLLLALPFQSAAQARKRARSRPSTHAPAPAAAAPALVYQAAYQHILRSPEFEEYRQPCVAVFDSLVFQDYVTFSEALRTEWNFPKDQPQVQLLDSLFRMDERADHRPFYSPLAAKLTPASGAQKGCAVILFSRLSKNTLLAEVSLNEEGGPRVRDILSTFNKTLRYLLLFSPDGKVKRYYTKVINYN